MKCTVCGSPKTEKIIEYGDIPLCDKFFGNKDIARSVKKFNITVQHCFVCSHSELIEKVPKEKIYSDYIYKSTSSPDLKKHFAEYATWADELMPKRSNVRKHMDIGCNDGLLLDETWNKGFETTGIDPSPIAKSVHKDKHTIINEYFSIQVPLLPAK